MLFSEKQARMMKLWSHAVVIDTGITVEDEEQYKEASTDLDNAMQEWATVPISVYFKGVSEETLNEEVHKVSWIVEAVQLEDEDMFAVMCKVMLEIKSVSKPDILKPNLRVALLEKLAAVAPIHGVWPTPPMVHQNAPGCNAHSLRSPSEDLGVHMPGSFILIQAIQQVFRQPHTSTW